MNKLKQYLNVCIYQNCIPLFTQPFISQYVAGKVSLTCDAWQASNADGYFAVTGHWIKECSPGKWTLKHALFGFMWMNTAYNGNWLGQALFKICLCLSIVHKVNCCGHSLSNITPTTSWFPTDRSHHLRQCIQQQYNDGRICLLLQG